MVQGFKNQFQSDVHGKEIHDGMWYTRCKSRHSEMYFESEIRIRNPNPWHFPYSESSSLRRVIRKFRRKLLSHLLLKFLYRLFCR
jgi:hypothetical protein